MANPPDQTAPTIKTRILIISDTHTALPHAASTSTNPTQQQRAFRWPLPPADVLIHCGDLTSNGALAQHERTVCSLLKPAPAKLKLVIPGNHDITLDAAYYGTSWQVHGGRSSGKQEDLGAIRDLYEGDEARGAGIVYLEEGFREFRLENGAKLRVYASAWTPEFCNWAFAYPRSEDRFNETESNKPKHPVPGHEEVDVMITHGPPKGILDRVLWSGERVGCEHLMRAVERCRPRLHAFGQIHEGWGAVRMDWERGKADPVVLKGKEEIVKDGAAFVDVSKESGGKELRWGKETLFVNASIMNLSYQPRNAPWVVDVNLPLADN